MSTSIQQQASTLYHIISYVVMGHRSRVDVPPTDLFQWHAREGALERLSATWRPFNIIQDLLQEWLSVN